MKLLVDYKGLYVEAEIIIKGFEEKYQSWTPDFSEILCDDFIRFPSYKYPQLPIVPIGFFLDYVKDLWANAESYDNGNATDFLGNSEYEYYSVNVKTDPIYYYDLVYLYYGDDVGVKDMIIGRLRKFGKY